MSDTHRPHSSCYCEDLADKEGEDLAAGIAPPHRCRSSTTPPCAPISYPYKVFGVWIRWMRRSSGRMGPSPFLHAPLPHRHRSTRQGACTRRACWHLDLLHTLVARAASCTPVGGARMAGERMVDGSGFNRWEQVLHRNQRHNVSTWLHKR
jgi:hypothetical protein